MTQGIDPLKDTSVAVVFTVKSYKGVTVNTVFLPKGNYIIHLVLVKFFKFIYSLIVVRFVQFFENSL